LVVVGLLFLMCSI